MRGSAFAAVANVPCTGLPFLSTPPVDRGKISYQALKRAAGRSTQTPYCSPRVIWSRSGYCASSSPTSADSAAPARVNGSPGLRSSSAASISGSRSVRGHAGCGALQQSCADDEVVGQLGLALARVEFGGDGFAPGRDRVAPAVDPERPQTDPVGGELAVKTSGVRPGDHRDGLRFDLRRRCDHRLDRHGRRSGLLRGSVGDLRIVRAVVAHHQRRRDSVVPLAPHRGPDRHHLADDGLGGIAPCGHHRCDVIDPDSTGHLPTPSRRGPR